MTKLQGINFRATSGFVTDGTGDTYQISDIANYPFPTPQGVNVGWEQNIGFTRDRNSGLDARLAGFAACDTVNNGGVQNFRIDLDASGSHDITIAAGDATYAEHVKVELFDGTTSLGVLVPAGSTSGGGKFKDATGTEYSSAAWPGSNTPVTKTFAGTICRFRIGDGTNACAIAHVAVTTAAGGGTNITPPQVAWHWNGFVPGIDQKTQITPPQKAWNWTGNIASFKTQITPPLKQWNWNGFAPTIAGNTNLTPPQKSWTWAGTAPTINSKTQITPPQKAWSWTGFAPSFNSKTMFTPPTVVWRWVGNAISGFGSKIAPLLKLMGMGT